MNTTYTLDTSASSSASNNTVIVVDSESIVNAYRKVKYFQIKKYILISWIIIELLEAIIFIIITSGGYYDTMIDDDDRGIDLNSRTYYQTNDIKRKEIVMTIIMLWTLVIMVRLLFLYGIVLERFWLSISFTVVSFGHIVIRAVSYRGTFNWIAMVVTVLITIVSIMYVMDLHLRKQEQMEIVIQKEKQQQKDQLASNMKRPDIVIKSNRNSNNGSTLNRIPSIVSHNNNHRNDFNNNMNNHNSTINGGQQSPPPQQSLKYFVTLV